MPKYLVVFWSFLLAACQVTTIDPNCMPSASEKKAWAVAQKKETSDAYRAFLKKHPKGCYANAAAKMVGKPVKPVAVKPVPVKDKPDAGKSPY